MTNHAIKKGKIRPLSDADEARVQRGIAADPEWTRDDFKRAKPFAECFPTLAKNRRANRDTNR